MLCQLIGIMSDIEHESLVLIDEPENSAHPSWQVNYIGWLKDVFNHYGDSHFVIATHSHFLLTDLKPETSDIIALVRGVDNNLKDVSDGVNTFNWSVDDILYRVFGVRNTRNRAFEEDIMQLYKLLSEGSQYIGIINTLRTRLARYELPGNDPLKEIINQARRYVENR